MCVYAWVSSCSGGEDGSPVGWMHASARSMHTSLAILTEPCWSLHAATTGSSANSLPGAFRALYNNPGANVEQIFTRAKNCPTQAVRFSREAFVVHYVTTESSSGI